MRFAKIALTLCLLGCAAEEPKTDCGLGDQPAATESQPKPRRKPNCLVAHEYRMMHELTEDSFYESGPCECGLDKDNDGFLDEPLRKEHDERRSQQLAEQEKKQTDQSNEGN